MHLVWSQCPRGCRRIRTGRASATSRPLRSPWASSFPQWLADEETFIVTCKQSINSLVVPEIEIERVVSAAGLTATHSKFHGERDSNVIRELALPIWLLEGAETPSSELKDACRSATLNTSCCSNSCQAAPIHQPLLKQCVRLFDPGSNFLHKSLSFYQLLLEQFDEDLASLVLAKLVAFL